MREDPQSFGETFFMALQLVLTSVEQISYGIENAMVLWNIHVFVYLMCMCLVSQHFLWCIVVLSKSYSAALNYQYDPSTQLCFNR